MEYIEGFTLINREMYEPTLAISSFGSSPIQG